MEPPNSVNNAKTLKPSGIKVEQSHPIDPINTYTAISSAARPKPENHTSTHQPTGRVPQTEQHEQNNAFVFPPPQVLNQMHFSQSAILSKTQASPVAPLACLLQPFGEAATPMPVTVLSGAPRRCPNCRAILSKTTTAPTPRSSFILHCTQCLKAIPANLLTNNALSESGAFSNVISTNSNTNESNLTQMQLAKHTLCFEQGVQASLETSILSRAVVFAIDLTLPPDSVAQLAPLISRTIAQLPLDMQVALITFSNTLQVYSLRDPEAYGTCSVFNCLNPQLNPVHSAEFFAKRSALDLSRLQCLLEALPRSAMVAKKKVYRGLGGVLEAIKQLTGTSSALTQVVAFLGAFPNFGNDDLSPNETNNLKIEKAKVYYRALAKSLNEDHTQVNLFCVGYNEFSCENLSILTTKTGGHLMMQKDIDSSLVTTILLLLSKKIGTHATLRVSCSNGAEITQLIGRNVTPEQQAENRRMVQCRIFGLDLDAAFAVYFEATNEPDVDHVDVQLELTYTSLAQEVTTLVFGRRLAVSVAPLDDIDVDATAILYAKRLVLDRQQGMPMSHLLNKLDTDLAKFVRDNSSRTPQGQYQVPVQATALARKYFHLRRGPLLGPILQHPDDMCFLHNLFLEGGVEQCRLIVEPQLLMAVKSQPSLVPNEKTNASNFRTSTSNEDEEQPEFYTVPNETLALQSDKILAMDTFTDLFVWSGAATVARRPNQAPPQEFEEMRQRCKRFVQYRAAQRFPQPHILTFVENESMARWLLCRLIPSHRDTAHQQEESFPQILELAPEDRKDLLSKFHKTGDQSYNEYLRQLLMTK